MILRVTYNIKYFCILIQGVMLVYKNYNVIAFKFCIQKFKVRPQKTFLFSKSLLLFLFLMNHNIMQSIQYETDFLLPTYLTQSTNLPSWIGLVSFFQERLRVYATICYGSWEFVNRLCQPQAIPRLLILRSKTNF